MNEFSWLYGASQAPECPSCGDRVWVPVGFYSPATMAEHKRWHCDGPAAPKDES